MVTYEITFNERSAKGKEILAFLKENKVEIKDPTKMTKEEFEAKCARGREQFERGECTVYDSEVFKRKLGLE